LTLRFARPLCSAVVVAAGFLLGCSLVRDSDVWTHLAHGRLIVAERGLPAHEPFTYPSTAMPYHNTEWLFGVVSYLVYVAGGPAGLVVLKAASFALTGWLLWRDAMLGAPPRDDRLRAVIGVIVVLAALLAIRYRVVERPDVALMIFLAATIYALDAFIIEGRRWPLYGLIPLGALWSNVHPSVLVAAAPFGAVIAGGVVMRLLPQRWGVEPPSAERLRVVAVVGVSALVATLLNPYGWDAITLPFRLAGSEWFRQEIGELQPPRLAEYPIAFALGALLAVVLVLQARRVLLVTALTVVPFAWLALSGVRFVFLLPLVVAAPLARGIAELLSRPSVGAARVRPVALASAVGCLLIATGLAVGNTGPLYLRSRTPGLGVDHNAVPEGALAYLDRIGFTGRLFNAFHFGGYVAWRDFPRRAPIVDGRAWLPRGLIEEIHFARVYPSHLARLQEAYGFEAAVMDYASFAGQRFEDVMPGADAGLSSPAWALVYWDDTALVYLRRAGRLGSIAERDQYRYVRPANGIDAMARALQTGAPVDAVMGELRRNARDTGSAVGRALEGAVALHTRDWDRALKLFSSVDHGPGRVYALQGVALGATGKGDLSSALAAYERVAAETDDPKMLTYAGIVALNVGREAEGIRFLERARRRDAALLTVYPPLLEAYRHQANDGAAADVAAGYTRAQRLARARQHAERAGVLLREGRADAAVTELEAALALDPGDARARSALGDAYAALGRLDDAAAAQRAALAIDARLAPAHYALALLAERTGDTAGARRHFTAFVTLEPRSYAAWRVRESLAVR
jgi:tetratricopeptide (TPR) repeat protein